jgi:hypothetical protein
MNEQLSFETDIKPLFREGDRSSMLSPFRSLDQTTTSAGTPMRFSPG